MERYLFAMSRGSVAETCISVDTVIDGCEEYFLVVLESNDELRTLMNLLGIDALREASLPQSEDFSAVFDFSEQRLPQLDKERFDALYAEWILRSGRETSMDEYGQLVFLQGSAEQWNKAASRFILRERTEE